MLWLTDGASLPIESTTKFDWNVMFSTKFNSDFERSTKLDFNFEFSPGDFEKARGGKG